MLHSSGFILKIALETLDFDDSTVSSDHLHRKPVVFPLREETEDMHDSRDALDHRLRTLLVLSPASPQVSIDVFVFLVLLGQSFPVTYAKVRSH